MRPSLMRPLLFVLMLLGLAMLQGQSPSLAAPARVPAPVEKQTPAYNKMIVFGDSLSDIGNGGRFSDGPIWVERMAESLDLPPLRPSSQGGGDYAVAGARSQGETPMGIREQVASYLKSNEGKADADALYVLFGGANDVLAAGCTGDHDQAMRVAAETMAASVHTLINAGARNVLIANLPDIGAAPGIQSKGKDCAVRTQELTSVFNKALAHDLDALELDTNGVRLDRLDLSTLFQRMISERTRAGANVGVGACHRGGCDSGLFWDELHPAKAAHAEVADEALTLLHEQN